MKGLGSDFSSFSATQMAKSPLPSFSNLLNNNEAWDMFQQTLESNMSSPAAFTAHTYSRSSNNQMSHGRGSSPEKSGRGGFSQNHQPHSQICRITGHYANVCPDQFNREIATTTPVANIAKAFSVSSIASDLPISDWYLDTGASAHMTPTPAQLHSSTPYAGSDSVVVGNGALLPISHIGTCYLNNSIHLSKVLVVPGLTKNLLSVSKLTTYLPIDEVFTDNCFKIQHRENQHILAQGSRMDGLYLLDDTKSALVAARTPKASFELWHSRLGHVAFDLDVQNALLNGVLSKPVYMEQSPSFIDPQFPNHVCRLKKAIYGLKQASLVWYQRFSDFLIHVGFFCSRPDPSLLIYNRGSSTIYLFIYVDDIIMTGNSYDDLKSFISRLHQEFAFTDLGKLGYFLGLEVTYTSSGIFLNQAKYARDILQRASLEESKPVSTPLVAGCQLSTDGQPFEDPTLYRSLVGSLQYLTITRPNLSFAVNLVSQHLQHPTIAHFQALETQFVSSDLQVADILRKLSIALCLNFSETSYVLDPIRRLA
ncbi:hypothetical protein SASPL_150632 [Salvia splendens]|uniref:Retrovirus-related Pol polyprotein from transposon RE1 n=1 Tax=Salvia splendens TaxID=180675 RepID=A0A8X8Z2M4_SALSN|nr:hypothetical protein SASPL_150632 [Salvia splendens]